MAIVRWTDPIREFAQLQDRINRVFSDSYGRNDEGLLTSGNWAPPVDIYQNGDQEVVLKAELPDMTREDIDVTVCEIPTDMPESDGTLEWDKTTIVIVELPALGRVLVRGTGLAPGPRRAAPAAADGAAGCGDQRRGIRLRH